MNDPAPLRLCFVTPSLPPVVGGAEASVQNLITGLAARGHRIDLVCGNPPLPDLAATVRRTGGEVLVPDSEPDGTASIWDQQSFRRPRQLHEFLARRRADLVHTFSHAGALAAAVALGDRGVVPGRPVLAVTHHEMPTEDTRAGHARTRFIYSLPQVNAYLPVGRHDEGVVRRLAPAGMPVIPVRQGVDCARFAAGDRERGRRVLRVGGDRPVVICPSRFAPWKGQLELLDAVVLCRRRGVTPDVRLIGSLNGSSVTFVRALRAQIADNGLRDQVRLIDNLPTGDMPHAMAAADVLVRPSWHDGLGLAALEAMASGALVVASAVGALDEFCVDRKNALVFEARDVPGLCEALIAGLSDPDLVAELRTNAVNTAEDFDCRHGVDDHEAAYAALRTGRRGRD
jgi:glycosyltransferase involved in cell wall biosynthesis